MKKALLLTMLAMITVTAAGCGRWACGRPGLFHRWRAAAACNPCATSGFGGDVIYEGAPPPAAYELPGPATYIPPR